MPWRIPPWGTWSHFKDAFPYAHIITKEAWIWPLQGQSSRAQTWIHPSLTFLQGTMPLHTGDSVSPWHHSTGGESRGWRNVVSGERREWWDEGWGCEQRQGTYRQGIWLDGCPVCLWSETSEGSVGKLCRKPGCPTPIQGIWIIWVTDNFLRKKDVITIVFIDGNFKLAIIQSRPFCMIRASLLAPLIQLLYP